MQALRVRSAAGAIQRQQQLLRIKRMADEKPDGETVRAVSIPSDKLLAFLQAKNVKPNCPMCATADWVHMEDEDNHGFLIYSQARDGSMGPKNLPLIAMVCRNCNYLWLVARLPVEAWLKEHHHGID